MTKSELLSLVRILLLLPAWSGRGIWAALPPDDNPDIHLNTSSLATKYGYPFEEHRVLTEDEYVLGLHRIPYGRIARGKIDYGRKRTPVLLQHGLGGSSADWILMGPDNGLAYLLADSGFDVWLGNNRGNVYSRRHSFMVPEDRHFWDFSWHEMGMYDLPAMIDHILEQTGHSSLVYVAHSQGTTQFFVMASERPAYNHKVALMVGLAPAAFTGHLRGPVTQMTRLTQFGVWVGENFGYPEFGSRSRWGRFISNLFCQSAAPTQFVCSTKLYLLAGFSNDIDLANLTVIIGHVPAGASWKQFIHFGQGYVNPGHFRFFDYGTVGRNPYIYGSSQPPEYKLENVSAPIALFSSQNDRLATPEDVELLKRKLRSVVYHKDVTERNYNHYDFIWGRSAPQIVFKPLMQLMDQYRLHVY